jgi:hypothetical protein
MCPKTTPYARAWFPLGIRSLGAFSYSDGPRANSSEIGETNSYYLPPLDHTLEVLLGSRDSPPPGYPSQESPAQVYEESVRNMSGRRSTRAASSRASSVAGSDLGQATPRRSTRNNPITDGSPLPALAPRGSTSYGSSIAALPVDLRRSGHGRDLTETLTDILGTVQENIQSEYGLPPNPPIPTTGTGLQAPFGTEGTCLNFCHKHIVTDNY